MADLVSGEAAALSALDYPDVWVQGELRLPLTYQFEPGADADGVTVHIPRGRAQPGLARRLRLAGARAARRSSSPR